ncbi:Flavin monooxygenase-like protein [Tolypocladium paradoxum]|uniref:Amine oxidase n=1 Tax=Tolypocladium paradoxum TaxID=94208 RepID=A0A2S4KY85_9HYPO|nr:Flavin monooxygenase-like protein [Tolypocladium paradoxum]
MATHQQGVDYDVVIIGAGISGLNFAYRLHERNPELSYCILEGRHEVGGTWSLFKYPGIRSDSDLFTFGFSWRPWKEKQSIAHGSLILKYLKESAAQEGIDKNIKFHHQVDQMNWSTSSKTWALDITVNDATFITLRTRFVFLGTGYYNYHEPLEAEIPGIKAFKGMVVHPQFWPTDLDYINKNVVIIGSGATAVTLLPSVAKAASHVTMLQRSPSYVSSVPGEGSFEKAVRMSCPDLLAYKIIRLKWILLAFLSVQFCRRFPNAARKWLYRKTAEQLPKEMALNPNFTPKYNPWQQRMCLCPEGDFYECLRSGKGSVKTGIIDTVTPNSIRLKSGEELHPDIIVTATGLKLRAMGGIKIAVDGETFDLPSRFVWQGAMIEDLPNVVLVFGYVDASWTLASDATSQLACRLLKQMTKESVNMIVPRLSVDDKTNMKEVPLLSLKSTYIERGLSTFPKVGDRPQWRPRSNYWKDLLTAWWGDIKKGTEWVQ